MLLLTPLLRVIAVLLAGFSPGPAHMDEEPVRTEVALRFYDVEGRSEGDLLHAMLRRGPGWGGRRFFGLTTSDVRFTYNREPSRTGCALRDVAVAARVTIVLPRWTPPQGTPYALERDWRRFETSLRSHEDLHRRLIEEEAAVLRLALLGLRAASCEGLDAAAQQAGEGVRARYVARHRSYDDQTGHGRTQGANWPRRG